MCACVMCTVARPITRRADANGLADAVAVARDRSCDPKVVAAAEACLRAALAEARLLGAVVVCRVRRPARAHRLVIVVCDAL
jgi:hypothetical protein